MTAFGDKDNWNTIENEETSSHKLIPIWNDYDFTLYIPSNLKGFNKWYISFNYKNEKISILIPQGCLYEPTLKNIELKKDISIGQSIIPIQKPIKLSFKLNDNKYAPEKYFLASNSTFLNTKNNDGWLEADSKSLGKYSIQIDTIPPKIIPLNFLITDTIINKETLKWKINDDKSSFADYDIFIDEKWGLLEYETKGSYVNYKRSKDLNGKHLVKIIIKDNCQNITIWEKELDFKWNKCPIKWNTYFII